MSLHPEQVSTVLAILNTQINEFLKNQKLDDYTPLALDNNRLAEVINQVMQRMQDNDPYNHPSYAGQMLKPPHPVAHVAYSLSMLLNPNNHALDGGRASSAMEKEVINILGDFFGYNEVLGHLTSSGTIANLEALFIARELNPHGTIFFSDQAHYTHSRMCKLLNLPYVIIKSDLTGKMDLEDLKTHLNNNTHSTVVCTAGTTALGCVDPISDIIKIAERYHVRVHVDAAYGGFFLKSNIAASTLKNYSAIRHADSIVIDPHKHGLQPYGCGAVLFKDPSVARYYLHDSPYTYYSSDDLHLGEISLECSRSGSAAVSLWSTFKYFNFKQDGLAPILNLCLQAANRFSEYVFTSDYYQLIQDNELDIVVYSTLGDSFSEISKKNQVFFNRAAKEGLHISLLKINKKHAHKLLKNKVLDDQKTVTVLRSVFMKAEHNDYIDKIIAICQRLSHL